MSDESDFIGEFDDKIIDDSNISEEEIDSVGSNDNHLKSKSGIIWSLSKPPTRKTYAENIMNSIPGATSYALLKIKSFIDCFLLFFTQEICSKIITRHCCFRFKSISVDLNRRIFKKSSTFIFRRIFRPFLLASLNLKWVESEDQLTVF